MTATFPDPYLAVRGLIARLRTHRASAACRARDRALVEAAAELIGGAIPFGVGAVLLWAATALAAAWNAGL